MKKQEIPKFKIRLEAKDKLVVTFSEDISEDVKLIQTKDGLIPVEFAAAVLNRAILEKKLDDILAGCGERCNKDCLW